jgi:hypothetical protein
MPEKRPAPRDERPTARAKIAMGSFSAEAEASATPKGLLAVGGLMAMILLSVAPIILAAAVKRRARFRQVPLSLETPTQRLLPRNLD